MHEWKVLIKPGDLLIYQVRTQLNKITTSLCPDLKQTKLEHYTQKYLDTGIAPHLTGPSYIHLSQFVAH